MQISQKKNKNEKKIKLPKLLLSRIGIKSFEPSRWTKIWHDAAVFHLVFMIPLLKLGYHIFYISYTKQLFKKTIKINRTNIITFTFHARSFTNVTLETKINKAYVIAVYYFHGRKISTDLKRKYLVSNTLFETVQILNLR